jgi:hypothetical protein
MTVAGIKIDCPMFATITGHKGLHMLRVYTLYYRIFKGLLRALLIPLNRHRKISPGELDEVLVPDELSNSDNHSNNSNRFTI